MYLESLVCFSAHFDGNNFKLLLLLPTNYLFKVKLVFPQKSEKQGYSWLRTRKLSSCKVSGERSVKKGTLIEANIVVSYIGMMWGERLQPLIFLRVCSIATLRTFKKLRRCHALLAMIECQCKKQGTILSRLHSRLPILAAYVQICKRKVVLPLQIGNSL